VDSYRGLIVWQKGMALVEEIYRLVKFLPREELYALSDQMRRAAVSIPSNIAEGHERDSLKEYLRFLYIAQGSRAELETQLELCMKLGYFSEDQIRLSLSLSDEISRMLRKLIKNLKVYT
jgi:four helix bundle protein